MMPLCFAAVLAVLASVPAFAQGSLTLSLETPGLEDRAAQEQSPHVSSSPTYTASSGVRNARQVPIGRVGTVESPKASIYSERSPKSRIFSTCRKETPLAIVGEIGEWYGVLMIDGSTGWIAKKHVKLLDYQVVSVRSARGGGYTSRGGTTGRSSSEYSSAGSRILDEAFRYMGVPYVWGGTNEGGMDCSGFVQKVFGHVGIRLPRTSREQAEVGSIVSWEDLQPGDRLYFACKSSSVDHCGIYVGNNLFIHSSASRGGVAIDELTKPFWLNSLVVARR